MDSRKNHLILVVSGALLGAMLSCTVFGDNVARDNDAPVGDYHNSQTEGPDGPVLPQDVLVQKLQRSDRERTPEGVLRARGAGAHGELVAAADLSAYTLASPTEKLQSGERFLDLFGHVPEATNTLTHLYADFGIPASYQMLDGNSVDAFKFVNAGDEIRYVKFHWKTPDAGNQVTRCEWHSSLSSKTLVGFRFSVRLPTFISDTPSQALVASSGSNSQEFSCSG